MVNASESRKNEERRGILLMVPTQLWMLVLLIAPLVLIVITSLGRRSPDGAIVYGFTFANYLRLVGVSLHDACGATQPPCFDSLYAGILWRSVVLGVQTTVLVVLIGYPLAYFIARAPVQRRNAYLFLVLVPLWTNFVIRLYAWIILLRSEGVINGVLGSVFALLNLPFEPLQLLYTPGAVLVGMVYEFLPFMVLPMYTSLEKIEPSLYEAASDLGADALRRFWRVTLPLSLPGIVAGTVLVFVPVMGTFIVSDVLGGRQIILVGNLIQRQFLDARDPAFGSAASIILMVLTLIVTLFYTRRFGFGEEITAG